MSMGGSSSELSSPLEPYREDEIKGETETARKWKTNKEKANWKKVKRISDVENKKNIN